MAAGSIRAICTTCVGTIGALACGAAMGERGTSVAAMGRGTLVGRIAQPEEIAAVICVLADPKISGYITGEILQVNGGLYLD